jgi:hypothetical protein
VSKAGISSGERNEFHNITMKLVQWVLEAMEESLAYKSRISR